MEKILELVFIPTPGAGHITSTVELTKLILNLHHRFSVTILVIRLPDDVKPLPESSNPRLKFLELHSAAPATSALAMFRLVHDLKPQFRKIVQEMMNSGTAKLAGIVIDMFCTTMIDVADEFGVPSYLYYTSGAAFLGLLFHKQRMKDELNVEVEYEDSEAEIVVGTYVKPVPVKVLPRAYSRKEDSAEIANRMARRYRDTKGIIINTFQELEYHAMQTMISDEKIPLVYAIGPVLKVENIDQNPENKIILKWLDQQPNSSVIFLCFGSMGGFGEEQLKQIALALENSGHRFLWSLRNPASKKLNPIFSRNDYENLEEALPEGFLQRNSGVGKVIGWAPQVAVLSHPAVGGFVSHCGWNSTLESIWCGVPVAAWPLYGEQQANSFLLVKDLEMAVEIKMDYALDFESETENLKNVVSADLIENAIKKLMDPAGNVGIRNKVKEMQEKSRLAVKEDGSSSVSLKCFLKNVVENIS